MIQTIAQNTVGQQISLLMRDPATRRIAPFQLTKAVERLIPSDFEEPQEILGTTRAAFQPGRSEWHAVILAGARVISVDATADVDEWSVDHRAREHPDDTFVPTVTVTARRLADLESLTVSEVDLYKPTYEDRIELASFDLTLGFRCGATVTVPIEDESDSLRERQDLLGHRLLAALETVGVQ